MDITVTPFDTVGFFAGACMLGAILFRNIYLIKALLATAAISFTIYGILLGALPLIVVNGILAVSGIVEIVRLMRKRQKERAISVG